MKSHFSFVNAEASYFNSLISLIKPICGKRNGERPGKLD